MFSLISGFLADYGGWAVFFLGVLEEVLFVIPSTLMFLATGFFIVDPGLSFWPALADVLFKITVWGALGVTAGSFFVYGIFYWGGKVFLNKYGKYFGLSWAEVEIVERKFTAGWKDEAAIFILRALPFWSITVVSAFCGLVRFSWRSFGFYTFLGSMVRITILGMAGWWIGEAYESFAGRLMEWEKYGTLILVIAVAALFWFYFNKRKKKR